MGESTIYFCFPRTDAGKFLNLDPEANWQEVQQGDECWIALSYLYLRQRGAHVELVRTPPDNGIVVYHGKHRRTLARRLGGLKHAVRVAVRGDLRGQLAVADFEIVQNPESADGTARHFLPHWPQPGLVPRDESRGNRIENLAFKGIEENLAEEFRDASWARCLAEYGVRWRCDAAPWRGGNVDRQSLRWPDFSDVDLVLAVRPSQAATRRKRATKLYNAWHAGVPALLGNEPAFRAIRRSELDYLEISSAAEALTAVTHLQREPALYRAMIRNGRERAVDWTIDSIARQWRPLLEQKIPEQAQRDRRLKTGSAAPSRRMKRRIEQLRAFLLRAPRLEVVKSNLDS